MNLRDMVKQYLEANGFDGLYSEGECACQKDDLFPCGEPQSSCRAGTLAPCPESCGEHDWHIKELVEQE